MSASKIAYIPLGATLAIVRLGLLLGLIFLRLVLTFLQGNQAPITCQITRFYLISCGIFVVQSGDKTKEGIYIVGQKYSRLVIDSSNLIFIVYWIINTFSYFRNNVPNQPTECNRRAGSRVDYANQKRDLSRPMETEFNSVENFKYVFWRSARHSSTLRF